MERLNAEKLRRLNGTGLRVSSGKLQSLFSQPSGVARPPRDESRRSKEEFSREQSAALFSLMEASRTEGRKGNKIFQLLESMDPDQSHSWQSYENHFRKAKAPTTVRHQAEPYELPFPNLICDPGQSAIDLETLPPPNGNLSPQDAGDTAVDDVSFSDSRVDIARNIYRMVGVEDKTQLEQLFKHPSISDAYVEYRQGTLDREQASAVNDLQEGRDVFRTVTGRSHHRWKVDYALQMLQSRSARFISLNTPKDTWTVDDHDVRFIVRLFMDAVTTDHPWTPLASERRQLCERALWLMLWFRWVHKPCAGTSEESERVRRNKASWLAKLPVSPPVQSTPTTAWMISAGNGGQSTVATVTGTSTPAPLQDLVESRHGRFGECAEVATSAGDLTAPATASTSIATPEPSLGTDAAVRLPPREDNPTPVRSSSSRNGQRQAKNEAKAASWLLEDAWRMFRNQEDTRLGSWGLTPSHKGTCIQVFDVWTNSDPSELLDSQASDTRHLEKHLKQRLQISLRGLSTPWARAAAWFKDWPRTGADLQWCWATNKKGLVQIHASHLCHQPFCINPNHLLLEPADTNFDRMQCAHAAKGIRALGYPVPEFCTIHEDHPCLMRLAALTEEEAFNIQFSILRVALERPASTPPPAPISHPKGFTTFEYSVPTQMDWPTVTYTRSDLVVPPKKLNFMIEKAAEKHLIPCAFCPNARRIWNSITAYWSHLRILHADQRERVITEVRRSAEAYALWAEQHFHDLAHHNTSTWIKIQQTVAADFSWDVIQGWRLPQDRLNYGRTVCKEDGPQAPQ